MPRKTLSDQIAELKSELRRRNRIHYSVFAEKERLRNQLWELKKPSSTEKKAGLARKELRDLGRIEAILSEWNPAGQLHLLQILKTVYNQVGEI